MWIATLVQQISEFLPFFSSAGPSIELERLNAIRVNLFKNSKINPEKKITEDANLVSLLSELCVELTEYAEQGREDFGAGIFSELRKMLDTQLGGSCTFGASGALTEKISLLQTHLSEADSNKKTHKKFRSMVVMLIMMSPLVGYGIHWAMGRFYQQALVADVDIVYPENIYKFAGGRYQLVDSAEGEMLEKFRISYFRDTLSYSMPEFSESSSQSVHSTSVVPREDEFLPLRYDEAVGEKWNLAYKVNEQIVENLKPREAVAPAPKIENLFVFRTFIRNILQDNIVSRMRVEARKISAADFPWTKLDVSAKLEMALYHSRDPEQLNHSLSVFLRAEHSPVKNVELSVIIPFESQKVVSDVSDQTSITTGRSFQVEFSPKVVYTSSTEHTGLKIESDKLITLNLDKRFEIDTKRFARQYSSLVSATETPNFGYRYTRCQDGGAVIVFDSSAISLLEGVEIADQVVVKTSFQELNNQGKSLEQKLSAEEPLLLLDDGYSNDTADFYSCDRSLDNSDMVSDVQALMPGGAYSLIDAFALTLMDSAKQTAPVIVVEKTWLFDFKSTDTSIVHRYDDLTILADGEYVLHNLVVTNFEGGDYEFSFYFEDEEVANVIVNLPWPGSFRYSPKDNPLFE